MAYHIRGYRTGDEEEFLAFDATAAKDWAWPIAFDAESLRRVVENPEFSPELFLLAFDGDRLVGHSNSLRMGVNARGEKTAMIFFPRTLPGHEEARQPLVDALCVSLRARGVRAVEMWGCTMWAHSFEWNETHGFCESADRPRGYKIYMTYDLAVPLPPQDHSWVRPVSSDEDRWEAAQLARIWYRQPAPLCLETIRRMEPEGLAHLIVQENERIVGACLAAESDVRKGLVAIQYIYVENAPALRQLLAGVMNACRAAAMDTLLVDLVNEHRHFEPTYRALGFRKAAEFAVYEKALG